MYTHVQYFMYYIEFSLLSWGTRAHPQLTALTKMHSIRDRATVVHHLVLAYSNPNVSLTSAYSINIEIERGAREKIALFLSGLHQI